MIDEKKIEEAAEKYARFDAVGFQLENRGEEYYYQYNVEEAFKAGINWFLDSLWHDVSEEPKDKSAILLNYTSSMCKWASLDEVDADDWKQTVKELGITRWLYIDDLLKGGK